MNNMLTIAHSACFELVLQQHGGCEDDDCSIKRLLDDNDHEECNLHWAMSGAACDKFNAIWERFMEA